MYSVFSAIVLLTHTRTAEGIKLTCYRSVIGQYQDFHILIRPGFFHRAENFNCSVMSPVVETCN